MDGINQLIESIRRIIKKETNAYDTTATVRRIEGDTAWVHIPGGVDETPVKLTIAASAGDNVQVRVSGGKAFLVGNGSAPPTDDTAANISRTIAVGAQATADDAKETAEAVEGIAASAQAAATRADEAATRAEGKADDAAGAATSAQQSADSALVSLATAQDVVGVLNWITAHGTMTSQAGGTYDANKVYFIVDPTGDYVVNNVHYSVVSEPDPADIDDYYVLTVDESVQNYVATHIVVDSEGLWIVPDSGGNKVLIAVGGAGHTYSTAGTYIIGKVNNVDTVLAKFLGTGAVIGQESGAHTTINSSGQKVYANDGTTQVVDLGYGLGKSQSGGMADAPYFTLGHRNVDGAIGNYSTAEGYNIIASGYASHAEGYTNPSYGARTVASGRGAHAEGHGTTASGDFSHAEGFGDEYAITEASGAYSHAEGRKTTASGAGAHAEGEETTASGRGAHAEGFKTIAQRRAQTVIGKYNIPDTSGDYTDSFGEYAFIIGNGANENARSNALTVEWSGNVEATGGATLSGDVDIASGKHFKINGVNLSAGDVGALAEDSNGDLSITRNITAGGDVTDGSGNVLANKVSAATASGSTTGSTSVASGSTFVNIGSITLPPGIWIVRYMASFQSNATGSREIALGQTSSDRTTPTAAACNGRDTKVVGVAFLDLSSATGNTTRNVYARHNAGTTLNVYPAITALRLY